MSTSAAIMELVIHYPEEWELMKRRYLRKYGEDWFKELHKAIEYAEYYRPPTAREQELRRKARARLKELRHSPARVRADAPPAAACRAARSAPEAGDDQLVFLDFNIIIRRAGPA